MDETVRKTITLYEYLDFKLPEDTQAQIDAYVKNHEEPGHFITAVLSNDLKGAIARADMDNLRNLPAIVAYCHNRIPGRCWGSREKVAAWIAKGGQHAET